MSIKVHLNVTCLETAPAPLRCKSDENSAVAWIPVEDIGKKSAEPWFVECIDRRL